MTEKYTPPLLYSKMIKAMKPKSILVFTDASSSSLKSIACRIGRETGRRYRTKVVDGGVKVWRDQ